MIEYRLKGPASQERQRIRLMSALRENRFPQSILIDGPSGIGKKALAIEIAKALLCTDPDMRPCGHCFGCKMAADAGATDNWVFPMISAEANAKSSSEVSSRSTAKTVQDYKLSYIQKIFENPYSIEIFDAAAEISVGLIRTLSDSFALKNDRVRVVIIAEADRMNEAASNAFLKTLEEVPANTYFILTTSSREKMLQTIRSRCLALHLLPLSDEEVRSETVRIMGDEAEDSIDDDIVGLAVGSPGKAIYYAKSGNEIFNLASKFLSLSLQNAYYELFELLDDAKIKEVVDAVHLLEVLSFLIADLIRRQTGANIRIPNTTSQISLEAHPGIDVVALNKALTDVQEAISRAFARRTPVAILLQALAIKLFEGYK